MRKPECLIETGSILGEGALWDDRAAVLWWVDITARRIHRTDPASGAHESFDLPEEPGSLAVRESGGLVLAMESGFHFFDPATGALRPIIDPEPGHPENRFNDGKPDREGRFWAGSMHRDGSAPSAALYRLDADLSCHRLLTGIHVSNGLAWSPDGRVLYHADSMTRQVWRFPFDRDRGVPGARQLFADTGPLGGLPDGATVDAEGCYWLALAFAGKIVRFDPDGRLMETIVLPVDLPTCVGFGASGLGTLFITTATLGRPASELSGQPLAGGLFALDPGVRGLPEARFRG